MFRKKVVRPIKISFQVRELMGIKFTKVLSYNYRSLRLPIWHVVEAPEGKWGNRRNL
jgi:hypothetical protein